MGKPGGGEVLLGLGENRTASRRGGKEEGDSGMQAHTLTARPYKCTLQARALGLLLPCLDSQSLGTRTLISALISTLISTLIITLTSTLINTLLVA